MGATKKTGHLRIGPRTIIIQGYRRHEFEIQAGTTYQPINGDIVGYLFNFRKIFIDNLGNSLQTFRCCLISFIFASPFTANSIEGHGTIGQGNIGGNCRRRTMTVWDGCKGLYGQPIPPTRRHFNSNFVVNKKQKTTSTWEQDYDEIS